MGFGRGLANMGKEAVGVFDIPGNLRSLGDSLGQLPQDLEKMKALYNDPGGYLGQRARAVGDAVTEQFSTPEGVGEAGAYGAAILLAKKAPKVIGPAWRGGPRTSRPGWATPLGSPTAHSLVGARPRQRVPVLLQQTNNFLDRGQVRKHSRLRRQEGSTSASSSRG